MSRNSERDEAAGMYVYLALVHGKMHSYEDAIAYARRAVEIVRPIPSAQRNLSQGLGVLANALQHEGDLENALQAIREAREIADKTIYSSDTRRMTSMCGILSSGVAFWERTVVSIWASPRKRSRPFRDVST
jgi:tetratricopeptide (TPR) repeat protein